MQDLRNEGQLVIEQMEEDAAPNGTGQLIHKSQGDSRYEGEKDLHDILVHQGEQERADQDSLCPSKGPQIGVEYPAEQKFLCKGRRNSYGQVPDDHGRVIVVLGHNHFRRDGISDQGAEQGESGKAPRKKAPFRRG